MADQCSVTDIVTAAGTLVVAVAAVWAALIAKAAATTWRDTLKNQSIDQCVSAIREIRSAADAVASLLKNRISRAAVDDAYTDAWRLSWRRFDQAYGVAARYYRKRLTAGVPNSIGNSLTELKTTFAKYDASNQAYDRAGLDRVMADLHKQITDVEKILQAIEPEK
jgi:hypothetical protein